ncbi:MAG: hypothetical protein B7733_17620 [Myxococcales bacterium FL481]|nr:MAG: hypothetical protein B7733_17620 [Myxococcales bacterium FL481]
MRVFQRYLWLATCGFALHCELPGESVGTLVVDPGEGVDGEEEQGDQSGGDASVDVDLDLEYTSIQLDIAANQLAAGALDGDDHLDLVVTVSLGNSRSEVIAYRGDGRAGFVRDTQRRYGDVIGARPVGLVGLDTDGDGRDTVVIAVERPDLNDAVLVEDRRDADGMAWLDLPIHDSLAGGRPVIGSCRADGDSSEDLCIAGASTTAFTLSRLGTESSPPDLAAVTTDDPLLATWADFDGDAYDDVLISAAHDELYLHLGGAIEEDGVWAMALVGRPTRLIAADVDGDEQPDAVLFGGADSEKSSLSYVDVAINRGGGLFRPPVRTAIAASSLGTIVVANLDGNSRQDFVLQATDADGDPVLLALVAAPDQGMIPVRLPATACACSPIMVGDYDEDGRDDVLGVSHHSGDVFMLRSGD